MPYLDTVVTLFEGHRNLIIIIVDYVLRRYSFLYERSSATEAGVDKPYELNKLAYLYQKLTTKN